MAVDPDAIEEVLQELAARLGVGLLLPEAREVVEDRAGLVEVGAVSGSEAVELGIDTVAFGDVLGFGEVAELVEVAQALAALLELAALASNVGVVGLPGVGEAIEDLVADGLAGSEVRDERDYLALDRLGGGQWLVAAVLLAARGAVVAGLTSAAAGGAVHPPPAARTAHDAAQQVASRRSAWVQRRGALPSKVGDAVEQRFVDERLMLAADLLAGAAL